MQRRNILSSGTSLAGLVAVVACTPQPPPPAPSPTSAVQTVFAQVQYVLPVVKFLAAGISIAVPASAGLIKAVTPYLDNAGAAFQAFQVTMTDAQARPIVAQVLAYLRTSIDLVATLVNTAGPDSKLAQFAPQVKEAQAVLAMIAAFVSGAQAGPLMARISRQSLPLLHR